MGQVGPQLAKQFLRGVSHHPAESRIHLHVAPIQPGDANTGWCILEDRAEALFALAQRFLGAPALGDVRAEADVPHVFAGRRKARFGVGAHETPFAIGPANARFGTEGSVLPYRAAERIDESRRIGGMNKLVPFAALHLLAGHAAEFSVFPVDEPNFSVNAGDPQQRWAAVGHGAEAFFTLAQRLLGVPAL